MTPVQLTHSSVYTLRPLLHYLPLTMTTITCDELYLEAAIVEFHTHIDLEDLLGYAVLALDYFPKLTDV